MKISRARTYLFCTIIFCAATFAVAQASKTQVVILGTGTPVLIPDRSGPAVAVVVNGTPYLVDFGPGVVRRAAAAARDKKIAALTPANIKVVFCTHLHSDHTAGLADLYLSPAVEGRPGRWNFMARPASLRWRATFKLLM